MTTKTTKRTVTTITVEWVAELADDNGNVTAYFRAKYGLGLEGGEFIIDTAEGISAEDYAEEYAAFKEEFLAAIADIEVRKVEKDED